MCCGPLRRARILLYVLYALLFFDLLIWLGFVGGGIYIWQRCPEELDFHVELGFSHFVLTFGLAACLWEWWKDMADEEATPDQSPRMPTTLPIYWIVGALVALSTDAFLLIANVLNPEPSTECTFRTLHKTLEATGIANDSFAIIWFFCVTAASWRQIRKQGRERRRALNKDMGTTQTIKL